jgi:hypothetical protein
MNPSDVEYCYWTGVILECDPPDYQFAFKLKDGTTKYKYLCSDSRKDVEESLKQQGYIIKDRK